jgi:hypothetical protein
MIPIVFAVFANDRAKSLNLSHEIEAMENIFIDRQSIRFEYLENSELPRIQKRINQDEIWKDITVFHFGGHSDGENISLADSQLEVELLVSILGGLPKLQLIFLNGCDNYLQVKAIQEAGIKAAIITTVNPLSDVIAVNFAKYFYTAYFLFRSIGDSFQMAQDGIVHQHGLQHNRFLNLDREIGQQEDDEVTRSIGLSKSEAGKTAIYILSALDKEDRESVLRKREVIPMLNGADSSRNYQPNRLLIQSISNAIVKDGNISAFFSDENKEKYYKTSTDYAKLYDRYDNIQKRFEVFGESSNNENFEELVDAVLTLLPFPICFHINRLSENGVNWKDLSIKRRVDLLKRQVATYDALVQVLAFTFLSCLWKVLETQKLLERGGKKLDLSPGQTKAFKSYLSSSSEETANAGPPTLREVISELFNERELGEKKIELSGRQKKVFQTYLAATDSIGAVTSYPILLGTIREIFNEHGIHPFVSEYEDSIFPDDDSFFRIHLHMQNVKKDIESGYVNRVDLNQLCKETEDFLSDIFKKTGFVIRYRLCTVKSIEFSKSRLEQPAYFIRRTILSGLRQREDDVKRYAKHTDSFSVILARGSDEETFTDFLSLSPFIIDENAIKGENLSLLYFFSHRQQDEFVYQLSEDPMRTLKVKDKTYTADDLPDKTSEEIDIINLRMLELKKQLLELDRLITQ